MKRGNTALKRGVAIAAAFTTAIAGAVLAAPAASATVGSTGGIRPTPVADSIWVGADGNKVGVPAASAVYVSTTAPASTDHATGVANLLNIGSSYQNVGGLQIALPTAGSNALPGWDDDTKLTIDLTGAGNDTSATPKVINATFSKVPTSVSISTAPVAASQLDTRSGAAGGTAFTPVATTADAKAGWKASASLNDDHTQLQVTLPNKADAPTGTTAGFYVVSLDGVQISLGSDADVTAPVIVGTAKYTSTAPATVTAGATTVGYVNPVSLTTSGDATYTNNTVTLPALVISEATKAAFDDSGASSFSLQVSGTDLDSTHKIAFDTSVDEITGASTTAGKTVSIDGDDTVVTGIPDAYTKSAAAGSVYNTVTVDLSGADDSKLEKISASGLKIVNVKPGTDITVTIVADADKSKIADAANSPSGELAFAPSQTEGASVTIKASDKLPRVAGDNRYDTAAKIAALSTWGNAVVLANGLDAKDGADALSASFLAAAKNAPVLLTATDALPKETRDALTSLFKDSGQKITIYVMGKTDSVSQAVRDAAVAAVKATINPVGSVEVVEVAGANRYATSAAALDKAGTAGVGNFNLGKGNLRTAFLASGQNNADALAASGLSANLHLPVLLTSNGDELPAEVASAITDQHLDQIVILGSTDRVSQKVEDALKEAGANVIRVAGANRYETAVKLSTLARKAPTDGFGATGATAYLANGDSGWVDALSVGPLVGKTGGSILTVGNGSSLPAATASYLKDKDTTLTAIQALGQSDRIPDSVITEATKALQK